MRRGKFAFLIIRKALATLLFALFFNPSFAWALTAEAKAWYHATCSGPFSSLSGEELLNWQIKQERESEAFSRQEKSRFLLNSRKNAIQRIKAQEKGQRKGVDILIVGGGNTAATIAATLRALNPHLSVAILERGSSAGVFDDLRNFTLNYENDPRQPTANILGSPVQQTQFDAFGRKYPLSGHVGNATLEALYASEAELLFEQELIGIYPHEGDYPYLAKTKEGLEIPASLVVLAPGMGDPSHKMGDQLNELIQTELKGAKAARAVGNYRVTPGVMYFPEALRCAELAQAHGIAPEDLYRDKSVAIVGPGDGGVTSLEAIAGLLEGAHGLLSAKEITVYGNSTVDTYQRPAHVAERYASTLEMLKQWGHFSSRTDHVYGVYKIADHQFEVSASYHDQIAEVVILATGYKGQVQQWLDPLHPLPASSEYYDWYGSDARFRFGELPDRLDLLRSAPFTGDVTTGLYAVFVDPRDGKILNNPGIFLVGPGMGISRDDGISNAELSAYGRQGSTINVFGRRSEIFSNSLYHALGGQNPAIFRWIGLDRRIKSTSTSIPKTQSPHLSPLEQNYEKLAANSIQVAEILFRRELGKLFFETRFHKPDLRSTLKWEWIRDDEDNFTLVTHHIPKAQAELLAAQMTRETPLGRALHRLFAHGARSIEFSAPVLKDGRVQVDGMNVHPPLQGIQADRPVILNPQTLTQLSRQVEATESDLPNEATRIHSEPIAPSLPTEPQVTAPPPKDYRSGPEMSLLRRLLNWIFK